MSFHGIRNFLLQEERKKRSEKEKARYERKSISIAALPMGLAGNIAAMAMLAVSSSSEEETDEKEGKSPKSPFNFSSSENSPGMKIIGGVKEEEEKEAEEAKKKKLGFADRVSGTEGDIIGKLLTPKAKAPSKPSFFRFGTAPNLGASEDGIGGSSSILPSFFSSGRNLSVPGMGGPKPAMSIAQLQSSSCMGEMMTDLNQLKQKLARQAV